MLKLYNAPQSTCSQKVRLTLAEKGLEFEDVRINLFGNEQLSDWYLRINPNGVVPTLQHGGAIVVDSSVINEYLDETQPGPKLVPAEPLVRARMRAWRQFIDEVPTAAIRVHSFNAFVIRKFDGQTDEEVAAVTGRMPLRKHFYRRMGREGFSDAEVAEAQDKLRLTLERMARALETGPWLIGEQFTLADISLVPTLVRLEDLHLWSLWRDLPAVAGWYARVQARPSFSAAYYPGSRDLFPTC